MLLYLFSVVSLAAAASLPDTTPSGNTFSLQRLAYHHDFKRMADSNARRRRMLERRWKGLPDLWLDGDGMVNSEGLYHTNLILGTPPKSFKLAIDSGSDISWVKCLSNDTDARNVYNAEGSSTGSILSCHDKECGIYSTQQCSDFEKKCIYEIEYMDQSGASGYFINDTVEFEVRAQNVSHAHSSAHLVLG
uniref:Peptidase A1 domain-containing protein n=1 Tax=Kalanchoe fedtschenkoi TaxID=63787 RepID=A0A7N0TGX2_KALFE